MFYSSSSSGLFVFTQQQITWSSLSSFPCSLFLASFLSSQCFATNTGPGKHVNRFFLWNLPNCCLWCHLNVCMMLPNLCLRFIFLHSFIHQQYQTQGLSSGPRASVDVADLAGRFSGWSHKDQSTRQLYIVLYGAERGCRKSAGATVMMPQQCHQCSSEFRQEVCVGRKM